MEERKFYDGTKLLSMLDANGNKPEIYICTSNRSAGKTTFYSRYLVKRFFKYGEKFMLLYRFNYEIDNVADKFFKDIQGLFFPNYTMTSKRDGSGSFHRLFLNAGEKQIECGYAVALNSADQLKKNSHLLSDVSRIFFDEFQSETNHYCDNEIRKFMSIHTTVARGGGEFVRYVPVIMCSNPVSLINPYYIALNVSAKIRSNTHFLKGDGFVIEQGFNEYASIAQSESGFMRAFENDDYTEYSVKGTYLNDNLNFIEKPKGYSRYIATVRYNGSTFGIRSYPDAGIIYCDTTFDETYPVRISVTTDDHDINYVMLRQYAPLILNLRFYFEKGCFRFKDLRSKECVLTMLSY